MQESNWLNMHVIVRIAEGTFHLSITLDCHFFDFNGKISFSSSLRARPFYFHLMRVPSSHKLCKLTSIKSKAVATYMRWRRRASRICAWEWEWGSTMLPLIKFVVVISVSHKKKVSCHVTHNSLSALSGRKRESC